MVWCGVVWCDVMLHGCADLQYKMSVKHCMLLWRNRQQNNEGISPLQVNTVDKMRLDDYRDILENNCKH